MPLGTGADSHSETRAAEIEISKTEFTVIWAAPILPGKTEAWRRFMQEMMGDRRQDYEQACRRLGIWAMRGWVTETARAVIGVIAVAASQPEQVMTDLSESNLAFDRWFRSQLATLQGLDITRPPRMPPSDLVLNWPGPQGNRTQGGEDEP